MASRPTLARRTVKIDGKPYVIALSAAGKPVFASGARALQGLPTDQFEIDLLENVISGIGPGFRGISQGVRDPFITGGGGLHLPPVVTTPAATGNAYPVRYWIETQDANGKWILLAITPQNIYTVDIDAATPVVRRSDLASAIANANDFFGQPVQVNSDASASGTVKPRWLIPCNNADAILELTTVGTGGAVGSTAHTWTRFTTVLKGASHFDTLADGRVVRWNSSHSAGALLISSRAEISILPPANTASVDAKWGDDFPIGVQGVYGTSLAHYGSLIIAGKQDGYSVASMNIDGTLSWDDLLPDAKFQNDGLPSMIICYQPFVWHGKLYLPTPIGLYRSTIGSALPVGPGAIPELTLERAYVDNFQFYNGKIAVGEPAGRGFYALYKSPTDVLHVLTAREHEPGDQGVLELTWHTVTADVGSLWGEGLHRQVNGTGAPRLWWGVTNGVNLKYFALAKDGAPYKTNGSYGAISQSYYLLLNRYDFKGPALFREVQWFMDTANTHVTWTLSGDEEGTTITMGAGVTTDGATNFFNIGNDQVKQRCIFTIQATTDGTLVPSSAFVRLQKAIIRGDYIPDVGDTMQMAIDVERSAREQRVSADAIRTALKALQNAGSKAWVDMRGLAGFVLVRDAQESAPETMGQLRREGVMLLQLVIEEYS